MKHLSAILLIIFFLANKANAVHTYSKEMCNQAQTTPMNTFIDPSSADRNNAKNQKPGLIKRMVLKTAQKSILRKIAKGKLDTLVYQNRPEETINPNKRGLISVLFAGVGLLFLFVPGGLAGIGGLFAIAGFILGIIGLKRDEDITLALIGTIVGALLIALYVVVIYA